MTCTMLHPWQLLKAESVSLQDDSTTVVGLGTDFAEDSIVKIYFTTTFTDTSETGPKGELSFSALSPAFCYAVFLSVAASGAPKRPAIVLSACPPCTQPLNIAISRDCTLSFMKPKAQSIVFARLHPRPEGMALTQVCGLCRGVHAAVPLPVCLQLGASLQSIL